jgi:Fe-S-cluster containining protein
VTQVAAAGDGPLPAGDFSTWLADVHAAIAGERDADVACEGCTACCTSSQFVHIAPEERDALASIPSALLFPAPGLPKGHVLMGYDEHGCCPMLVDGACSIYDTRPRTCRTYDCRVFPAAGIEADDDKPLIAARARRWVFSHPMPADSADHDAVRAAAVALAAVPVGERPTSQTETAVRAVRSRRPSR